MDWEKKYIKYKTKYLELLKLSQTGGDFNNDVKAIVKLLGEPINYAYSTRFSKQNLKYIDEAGKVLNIKNHKVKNLQK